MLRVAGRGRGGYAWAMRWVLIFCSCLALTGCALIGPRGAPAPEVSAPPVPEETQTDAAPDRGLPGTTVASLGDVAQPGLWMRTPLVTAPMRGRVSDPATGRAVVLDLLPLDAAPGAGSRMSLKAYRELNLPLTSLPELRVEPVG